MIFNKIKKYNIYIILFALCFFVMLINSMTSPIYDISMLNDDAHLFYVIGRGIKYGKIPYIDLFDHKGIYMFFLTFFASFIEYKHIGLFIILFIFVYVNAIFIYKIAIDFVDDVYALLCTFIILVLHVSYYFTLGAFECETFLLTFIIMSCYLLHKYILKKENVNEHNVKLMFLHGVFAGIVLFMKPSVCIIWFGIGLSILIILLSNKNYKNLFFNIISGLLGVIIATFPGLLYCISSNCVKEMIDGTFLFNMQYMFNQVYDYGGTIGYFLIFLKNYLLSIVISLLSLIIVLKNNNLEKKYKMSYIILFCCSMVAIILSKRPYIYYANVLIPYFLPFIIYICYKIQNFVKYKKVNVIIASMMILLFFVVGVVIGKNVSYNKQEHLLKCANVIKKVYYNKFKNKKNVEIFGIGDSAFVFNVLEKLPNEKYFFTPKTMYDDAKDVYDEIYDYINSKKSDFIVVCLNDILVLNKNITKKYFDILDKKYQLISDELGLYMYVKKN